METRRRPETFILVANRSGGRFLERVGRGDLAVRRTIDHQIGRRRDYDLETDRPGRSFSRLGVARHGLSPEQDAVEHEAEVFAGELASEIDALVRDHPGAMMWIFAEPRFGGLLRGKLGDPAARATRLVTKDMTARPDTEILAQLDAS